MLETICAGIFLEFEAVDMPLVHNAGEGAHARHLRECFHDATYLEMLDLAHYCLQNVFNSYYQARDVEKLKIELDVKLSQRTKDRGFFLYI